MNGYETHIPILTALFEATEINTVIEFGMGDYSTPFFLRRVQRLVSVEQQDKEWYRRTAERYAAEPGGCKWAHCYRPVGTDMGLPLIQQCENDVLGFVDGHHAFRVAAVNAMLEHGLKTVVIHDTGLVDYYKLRELLLPYGYNHYTYRHVKLHPRTTVITQLDLRLMQVQGHTPWFLGL